MDNISCLDEARARKQLSILGSPPEHFLEKFQLVITRIIAMHFNASHSTVKDILSRELVLRKSCEDGYQISYPTHRKSFVSLLRANFLHCWINIPNCSSKELQPVTSHGFGTLLIPTRCLHAGMRKWFHDSDREFQSKNMIRMLLTRWRLIVLHVLLIGQKYDQNISFKTYFRLCLMKRSIFTPENCNQNFVHMNNSM
jgi:hypothetical protein